MVDSLKTRHLPRPVLSSTLDTMTMIRVPPHPALKISWSSTYLVFTASSSATVGAAMGVPGTYNSSAFVGFRQCLNVLQQPSPLTFSTSSTNSKVKINATPTTSITLSFSARTLPSWMPRLYVLVLFRGPLLTSSQYRYNEITLVLRLWTHLHLLKRGGALHRSPTTEMLSEGSLATVCPACPHPGKNTVNLPESELYA